MMQLDIVILKLPKKKRQKMKNHLFSKKMKKMMKNNKNEK